MDIYISTLEQAVVNALGLLTRTRVRKDGPFWLLKPRAPLSVVISEMAPEPSQDSRTATAVVRCDTWGAGTVLTLTLEANDVSWLPWGPFTIEYGQAYPVASLFGRRMDNRNMYPMFASNPNADRHQELRIRSRAS